MTSSLHVSLPDEMRAYVDLRTNGKQAYATPSEYVRALIRSDMEKETERLYVFKELLKSAQDIENGNLLSAEALRAELDDMVAEWEEDEAKAKP
ncbi:MAG: CopG family transcriptional regulator [Alphaproteobacteria bacterium]|jgi:antitoxin ParD1/3/4|nr:CopG family transcriptional regulator [Alphaproteobacteria bacterium]